MCGSPGFCPNKAPNKKKLKCNIDKPKSGQHSPQTDGQTDGQRDGQTDTQYPNGNGPKSLSGARRRLLFLGSAFGIGFQSKQAKKTNKQSISITSIMR